MQKKRKKWYWLLAGLLILLLGAGGAWRYFHVDTKGTVARGSAEAAAVQGKKSLIVYFTYSENIGSTDGMDPDAVTSASLHGEYVNPEGNMQVMVRELQKRKIPFATGILFESDVDCQVAKELSDHVVTAPPFEPMTERQFRKAADLLTACEAVIDAGTPAGTLNHYNTELIRLAEDRGIPVYRGKDAEVPV